MNDDPLDYTLSAIRSLHDDVARSESRPSAEEICSRLLAIEALVVAHQIRQQQDAAKNAHLLPQPVPITVDDTPMTIFKVGGKLTATHPRAKRHAKHQPAKEPK
jgi:hypothetical protein